MTNGTKKIAIAIERAKLPTFAKRLKEKGYGYKQHNGPEGTLLLTVVIPDADMAGFPHFVRLMNDEARAVMGKPTDPSKLH